MPRNPTYPTRSDELKELRRRLANLESVVLPALVERILALEGRSPSEVPQP